MKSKFTTRDELYRRGYEPMTTLGDVLEALEPQQIAFIEPKTGLITALLNGNDFDDDDITPIEFIGFTGDTMLCKMVLLLKLDRA